MKQFIQKAKQRNWPLGIRRTLSIVRKLHLHKSVPKPIGTYGNELWGTTFNSNNGILQRFKSKTPRSVLKGARYKNNHSIHEDLQMNTVFSGIKKWDKMYLRKLGKHTSALAVNLLALSRQTSIYNRHGDCLYGQMSIYV
jgi:hypothetical protein